MAQNIINDPAFKKLLPQMPPLSGEVEFPTLDIMGQQTATAVNPPQPLVGDMQSRAETIGSGAMDVGAGVLGAAKQGLTNIVRGPAALGEYIFSPENPSLAEVTQSRGIGIPSFSGETPTPQVPDTGVFTPAGEQTIGQVTTAPQLGQTATGDIGIQPQVPNAQPAGGLPMIDGFDPNGVTFPTLGNPQLEQREAQIAQRVAGLTPEQRAQEIAMNDAAVNKAQIRGEEARGLFRPSEAQIGQAQTEAVARQADYEQRQINNRIDSDVKQFERDNPRATEQEVAMHRQQLIQQESLAGKEEVAGKEGLTFDQQLALRKEDRAAREEARGVVADATEAQTAKQETETKETDLYNLHQDSFDRQERYIEQALKNTGMLSTGFASISKFAPGTPARQLEESLKPILGEAAFGRLQQMRDASKTGGALGQVSERELGLLESAMGALSTSQNESQFRANLLAYRKQMRESNARIQEAYKQKQSGGSGDKAAPRYDNDVNTSQSLDDILLPTSK